MSARESLRSLWITDEMRERHGDEIWEARVLGGHWIRLSAQQIPASMLGLLREGDWLLIPPPPQPGPITYNLEAEEAKK